MNPSAQRIKTKLAATGIALVATTLVWSGGTFSAFNKTSSMPGNSVQAGTVVLADNDAGTGLLTIAAAKPGDSSTGCINVSYTGTAPSTVRLYGTIGGTGLAPYLTLVVTRGTFTGTPAAGSCTGFTADSGGGILYNGLLSAFPTTTGTAIADPAASWTSGDKRGYKLQVTLPAGAAAGAQGLTATSVFTWQAVSS
ncbi:MAG: hypothetical protein QOG68_1228 [Solirubrobacteraceae bacterium]|nr:hypothetical protein [Solirubrobacteraceae bacterium]